MQLDRQQIANCRAALPDAPRWVETRWMLAAEDVAVFAEAGSETSNFVVRGCGGELLSAVGDPAARVILEAIAGADEEAELLSDAPPSDRLVEALAGWEAEEATLYGLPADVEKEIRGAEGRMVAGAEIAPVSRDQAGLLDGLPAELRHELGAAIVRTTLMAAWIDGRPVAFSYAAAETETWWDVSVDTLEAYRGRGYAAAVAATLVERYRREGKRAAWGAVASNAASQRVAAKLGFEPVDRLTLFERS